MFHQYANCFGNWWYWVVLYMVLVGLVTGWFYVWETRIEWLTCFDFTELESNPRPYTPDAPQVGGCARGGEITDALIWRGVVIRGRQHVHHAVHDHKTQLPAPCHVTVWNGDDVCLIDWLIDWLSGWFHDWLVCWFGNWWCKDWLIGFGDWLIGLVTGWLVWWLIV